MNRILIVDDDAAVTNYLMVFFMQCERFEVEVMNDSTLVPELLQRTAFDVLLLDMDMPGLSGMDIIKRMHECRDQTPVIVLTGVADVELAVKAMKLGAFDYLTKPADDERLLAVVDAAISHRALQASLHQLPPQLKREDLAFEAAFEPFPTRDPGMIRLLHQAERIAASDLSVFLWGERGVGKEAMARAIHKASARRKGPFVAVDASALDPEGIAVALLGQARDWTGSREERPGFVEEAEGGTLFLDEVGCLTRPAQVRLKRLIQTGEYYRESSTSIRKADVRFIVASTVDLAADDYKERFSRDLLYHLVLNSLRIPALRERPDDIPLLAHHFLEQEARAQGREVDGFTPEVLALLGSYDFPYNLQELRTIVSASLVAEEGRVITAGSLPPIVRDRIAAGKG